MAKVINNSKAKLQAFEKANEVLVPVPLSQPTPLINAIAELGNFTPPPPTSSTPTPDVATIPYGYPIKQAQTIESGGLPVQRLETNGLFNLVSNFIKYWSQGGATKFDNTFGIAPGQGYTTGSVLYYADPTNPNNPINGWYTKLNNNADTTFPNTNWKQITNVTPPASLGLYQQGRLTGVSGSPYGDTIPIGNQTLYFTPTYDGNLISLWNGTNWVTQSFNELALPISVNQGTLQPLSTATIATGTNPQSIAIYPNGTFVYVTNFSANTVSIYTRNTSGILALSTTIGALTTPNAITITPDSRNIYWTVSNSGSNIYQGAINADGTITGIGNAINMAGQGNGIGISPDSNFVYICGSSGNNFVYQFSRNADGSLLALSTTKIATGNNPTAISISPDGDNVYVTNGTDRTVSQYSRNPSTGLLSLIGTTAVIPSTVPAGIIVSPDGLNVYVTNQGTNSISQYSRATDTGLLTVIGSGTIVQTGTTPSEITITPDGSFVYVINNGSSNISQYSRNSSTGILLPLGTPVLTANTPTAITITLNGNNVYVTNNGSGTGSNTVSEYSVSKITDVTLIQDNTYDIYVGKNASGVLILSNNAWTNNTVPPTRTNINGKWVNGADNTKLFVGSINVSGGVVQSWSGNRSIWNLYNQVSKPLVASQGNINIIATSLQWWVWRFSSADTGGIRWRNQWYDNNNSTTDGLGRFSFILDPLYNKRLLLSYIGTGTSGINTDNLLVGIIANASAGVGTASITPLEFSIQNNDPAGIIPVEVSNVNVITYSYSYDSSSTGYTTGLNYIQKIELTTGSGTSSGNSGFGYASDTGGGLTAEYWG